ncbi:MAG: holo-ACP synthase [Gammaproteobacteria bacterium]|nr:holo-ACP synthase [Gammaproteobacteria bacterium]
MGVDLVKVARIERLWQRYGERFVQRILTPMEQKTALMVADPVQLLAKRFAIKEAAVKALGTGFRNGIGWQDLCVTHTELGKPQLVLVGKAQQQAVKMGVTSNHVTVSDEKEYVVGMVLFEGI